MKKFKILFIFIILFSLTGCFNNDSMDDISITTSIYPIEYVVKSLYGEHSTINSLYPKDTDASNFEVTNVLLDQYSDNDLFIFNGLTEENSYVNYLLNKNKNLKIIDVTSNMQYDYSIEELWLDPNNLLTIANNIRKGFKEYIKSTYLTNEIDANYENLKIELTSLDGKYYNTVKNASNNTIIVSDNTFLFLEKYGLKVISLDPDTVKEKTIETAKEAIENGECSMIFVKYQENTESINDFIDETDISKIELYTMTNLQDINVEKSNYITLMNQNLENLKLQLYK
jgi:zinc transport system substrate-binding protein